MAGVSKSMDRGCSRALSTLLLIYPEKPGYQTQEYAMAGPIEEFIFYGDDIRIERFPADTRMVYANPPITPIGDYRKAVNEALDSPIDALPLEKQLGASSRVTIAFDDPCLPVPLMLNDTRAVVIEELLRRLFRIGIDKERIRLVCANGLHRKWTLRELSLVLGKKVVKEMGPGQISCHDATIGLASLGSTPAGHEVEISRAALESDITIYVNVNFTSMNGGWKGMLVGLGSWRSIRHHHTPAQWNADQTIMNPEMSPMHIILNEMGTIVRKHCNVFQMETVLNNKVWPWPVDRILTPVNSPSRNSPPGKAVRTALSLASLPPGTLKRYVRNTLVRSDYRPSGVWAGDVDSVHEQTLDLLYRQQNVETSGQADILILGVPNLSPYSARSVFNPILLRSLTVGYLMGLFKSRPVVKKGGVIVACNPGREKFHPFHHPSYVDFWNRDLEEHYNPVACWDDLSESYAENPRYLDLYRNGYAYHGTHSLINWMWSGRCMEHVGHVILAGAKDYRTAKKIGFTPAPDFPTALSMAREITGNSPSMVYQVIPPLFCIDIK